ncbi:MAG: iron chelate uptake ABC transporter family permease subunit [Firmicutes bacterium]|nr:iron chelate uptake ABC transporter family permease subunit [Bacillota bacterium]
MKTQSDTPKTNEAISGAETAGATLVAAGAIVLTNNATDCESFCESDTCTASKKPKKHNNRFVRFISDSRTVLGLLIFFFVASSVVSLFLIPNMPIRDIFSRSDDRPITAYDLFIHTAVPRTLAIIAAGAGMSICGLIMQTLTANKFVSPMTAGTLDGARFGAVLAMILIPGAAALTQGAFAFALTLATTMFFIFLIERIKIKNAEFVPLIGIVYGGVIASVTTFIVLQTAAGVQIAQTMFVASFAWQLSGWAVWAPILITSSFVVVAYIFANFFMMAGLGEGVAKNLGLNYRLTVNIGLVIVAIITASIVLMAGVIAFLGLIVPNIVSMYMGDNLRRAIPVTMVGGATFLLICDIISRAVLWPLFEIPVGLTVGVLGGIVFLFLILAKRRAGSA